MPQTPKPKDPPPEHRRKRRIYRVKGRKVPHTFRLPRDLDIGLHDRARRERRTLTQVVERALEYYFRTPIYP